MDNTKTAEEILKSNLKDIYCIRPDDTYAQVLKSMEEYASPLKKRIEELERVLSVVQDRFSESTGKFRNEIEELRNDFDEAVESNENLRKEIDGLIEIHHLQSQELLSEIERLKESNKDLKNSEQSYINEYNLAMNAFEKVTQSNKELVEALDDNKAAADQAMRALERYGKGSQKKQEDLDLTEIAQCLYSIRNPDSEVFVKSEK